MADDKVSVEITGTFEGLVAALEGAKGNLQGMAWNVGRLTESFHGLGEAFIAALGTEAVARFAERMADLGAETMHIAQETGLAVGQIAAFGYAAREMGVGTEEAGLALSRFERNMVLAASGESLTARAAFQALGISVKDAGGHIKTLAEILPEIAQRFHDTADGPTKTAVAMELFGRAGMRMIPILDEGAAGLEKLGMRARESGALTQAMAERAEDAVKSFADLGSALTGVLQSAFDRIAPAITYMTRNLTDWANVIIRVLNVTDQAKFDNLMDQLHGIEDEMMTLKSELGQGLDRSMSAHLEAQLAALEQKHAQVWAALETLRAHMTGAGAPAAKPEMPAMPYLSGRGGGNADAQEAKDLEREMNDELRQRIALIESNEQVAQAYAQRRVADAQLALRMNLASGAQALAAEVAAENERYRAEQRALMEKLALYREDEVAYRQDLDAQEVAYQRHQTALDRLYAQAAERQKEKQQQSTRDWVTALKPLNTAFDGMLQGVLQGTQTFGQAMAKMFENIALSFAEQIAKMIAQWLAFEALTQVGGALPWRLPFGNPFGAGAGGLGGLIGGQGSLIGFAVGSYSVPSTMPALVHQGEMILPASFAEQVRSGQAGIGAGGGIALGLTVYANDAKSFQQQLLVPQTLRLLAAQLGRYMAFNPSTQGAF